jgi:hypothetical protein
MLEQIKSNIEQIKQEINNCSDLEQLKQSTSALCIAVQDLVQYVSDNINP